MTAADVHIARFNIIAPAILAAISVILAVTAIETAVLLFNGYEYWSEQSDPRNYPHTLDYDDYSNILDYVGMTAVASCILSSGGALALLWAGTAVAASVFKASGAFSTIFGPIGRLVAVSVLWALCSSGAGLMTYANIPGFQYVREQDRPVLVVAEVFGWIAWFLLTIMLAVAIYSVVRRGKSGGHIGEFSQSGGYSSVPTVSAFTSGTVGGVAQPKTLEMGQVPEQQQPVTTQHSAVPSQQRPVTTHHSAVPSQQQPVTPSHSAVPPQQQHFDAPNSVDPPQYDDAVPHHPYPTYDSQTAAPQQNFGSYQGQFAAGSFLNGANSGLASSSYDPQTAAPQQHHGTNQHQYPDEKGATSGPAQPPYDPQTAAPQQYEGSNQNQFAPEGSVNEATSGTTPSFPEATHTAGEPSQPKS